MRVLIVGIIVLTLGVAGVSTYLIGVFSAPDKIEELEEKAKPKITRVLMARKNLKVGELVGPDSIDWQVWSDEAVNPAFIVEREDKNLEPVKKKQIGLIVRQPISAGEPLLASKLFKRGKQGVMSGILKSGYRAVSVAVNQTSGAAGFILPGDYVDVMLTHDKLKEVVRTRVPKDRKLPLTVLQTATETVLQKVRVLAIAQNVGETEKQAVVVPTVTLELSPKQAQIITTARSMGRLSLVLRSLEGASDKEAPRSFTTDVEVSPFMQNFDEIIQRTSVPADSKGPTQAEKDRDRLQKELEEMQKELAAAKAGKAAPAKPAKPGAAKPKPEPKSLVKIYRGGSRKAEQVQAK